MPLPPNLARYVGDAKFWDRFFFAGDFDEEDADFDEDDADLDVEDAEFDELDEDEDEFGDEDSEFPDLEECQVEFPVAGGSVLSLDLGGMDYISLELRHPLLKKAKEIGWDDEAHWHPHVLRWDELDLIGRCMALQDPTLPHPGLAVVLLHRFTPLCAGDDADVIYPLIETAYRSVGAFSEEQVEDAPHRYDFRRAGFHWSHSARTGWRLEQDEDAPDAGEVSLYTLRAPGSRAFPWRAWSAFLDEARALYGAAVDEAWLNHEGGAARRLAEAVAESGDAAALPELAAALERAGCRNPAILQGLREVALPVRGYWVVELLLGLERGSVIRRACGPGAREPRIEYRFEITLTTFTPTYRMPLEAWRRLVDDLDGALGAAELGGAEVMGMGAAEDAAGVKVEESITLSVTAIDDGERAVEIIRDVLRRHDAPPGTEIEQLTPSEQMIALE